MTATSRRVSERRQRLRRLSEADAARRCTVCRRAIVGQAIMIFGEPERYCSQDCLETAMERTAQVPR
jgi:predicted nuclease with RNAse H fold